MLQRHGPDAKLQIFVLYLPQTNLSIYFSHIMTVHQYETHKFLMVIGSCTYSTIPKPWKKVLYLWLSGNATIQRHLTTNRGCYLCTKEREGQKSHIPQEAKRTKTRKDLYSTPNSKNIYHIKKPVKGRIALPQLPNIQTGKEKDF